MISFKQVSNEWLDSKTSEIKQSTRSKYTQVIHKHLSKSFEEKDINEWTEKDFRQLFDDFLNVNHLSSSYRKTIRIVLKGILEYAEDNYGMEHIDLSRIKISSKKTKVSVLSNSDREVLEEYCESNINEATVPIYISVNTGMRLGEIAGLRWEDVDFKNGVIFVRRTVQRILDTSNSDAKTIKVITSPKSESSNREVIMTDYVMEYLKTYKNFYHAKDSDYVVTNSDAVPEPRCIQRKFKTICSKLGIEDINFHILRHTFATNCLINGVDVKALSEILGHSDIAITLNTYVHPTRDFKKEQMQKMNKLKNTKK